MSIAHAAVAAITPVPTVTPAATPSVTPTVHVVTQAAVTVMHPDLLVQATNYVNAHQVEFVVLAGAILVVAQNLVNKLPWLKSDADKLSQRVQDLKREVVAFGLAGLLTALWGLVQGAVPATLIAEWLALYVAAKAVYNGVKGTKVAVQVAARKMNEPTTENPAAADGVG